MSLHFATVYLTHCGKKITALYSSWVNNAVIKNFVIVSSGSLFLKGISLAVIPLTLNMLTPSQYGLLSLFISFNNIFIAIIGLGLRQVFFLEYYHCDELERKKITNSIIIIYLFFSIPALTIALCAISTINRMLFANTATTDMIVLSLLYCFAFFLSELFYQNLQYAGKALELTFLQIGIAATTIGLTVYLLYFMGWGLHGILLANAISAILALAIAVYYYANARYFNSLNFLHIKNSVRPYLLRGIPFVPGILFAWILSSGDKWVLAYYGNLKDVGIYAIADAFSQLFYVLILYPLSGSYIPWLLKEFSQNKEAMVAIEQQNRKIMYRSMLAISGVIFLGIVIGKPIFYLFIPSKFHESFGYIWPILMGNVFLMGSYFTSCLIQYHKKSYFLGLAICFPAFLNILLNFLLIPIWGIYGCSIATLLAYMAYFSLVLGYNKKLLNT